MYEVITWLKTITHINNNNNNNNNNNDEFIPKTFSFNEIP